MKKILLLGGTRFIGRVLMEQLLENGDYNISLFSRGQTNAELYPDIRRITGDRTTDDVLKIAEEDWDVIVDISCYFPLSLRQLLPALEGKVGRYVFISTGSVFDLDKLQNKVLEENMVQLAFTEEQLRAEGEYVHYGQKKAACEAMLMSADWLDKVILRPSIVYGRYDYTDRFYYWLHRIHTQEMVLLPIEGTESINLTYVDDLANIIRKVLEMKKAETAYNVATYDVMPFSQKLESIAFALGKEPTFLNVSKGFAETQNIEAFKDLPIVTNFDGRHIIQFSTAKVRRDFEDCLTPFKQSVKEMADFYNKHGWHVPTTGMSLEREHQLINAITSPDNYPA